MFILNKLYVEAKLKTINEDKHPNTKLNFNKTPYLYSTD